MCKMCKTVEKQVLDPDQGLEMNPKYCILTGYKFNTTEIVSRFK